MQLTNTTCLESETNKVFILELKLKHLFLECIKLAVSVQKKHNFLFLYSRMQIGMYISQNARNWSMC